MTFEPRLTSVNSAFHPSMVNRVAALLTGVRVVCIRLCRVALASDTMSWCSPLRTCCGFCNLSVKLVTLLKLLNKNNFSAVCFEVMLSLCVVGSSGEGAPAARRGAWRDRGPTAGRERRYFVQTECRDSAAESWRGWRPAKPWSTATGRWHPAPGGQSVWNSMSWCGHSGTYWDISFWPKVNDTTLHFCVSNKRMNECTKFCDIWHVQST